MSEFRVKDKKMKKATKRSVRKWKLENTTSE